MVFAFIIFFAVALFFALRIFSSKQSISIPVVFAGEQTDFVLEKKIPLTRNKPLFKEGNEIRNLDDLMPFIVKGHSLKPLSISDGDILYASTVNKPENILIENYKKMLTNRFVIINMDEERAIEENPCGNNWNNGESIAKKARKVVDFIPIGLSKEEFYSAVSNILDNDDDLKELSTDEKNVYKERIEKKYQFASEYYKDKGKYKFDFLLMSITYKKGKNKDYSFHSPKFMEAVVRYKSE